MFTNDGLESEQTITVHSHWKVNESMTGKEPHEKKMCSLYWPFFNRFTTSISQKKVFIDLKSLEEENYPLIIKKLGKENVEYPLHYFHTLL